MSNPFSGTFTSEQIVEHAKLMVRFYAARSRTLAADLVAGRIDDAEHERQIRELVAFVGEATVATFVELTAVEGSA